MRQSPMKITKSPAALQGRLEERVAWVQTDDAGEPWRSQVGLHTWTVRVNDFPEEHMYTLLINGRVLGSFDDWPTQWSVSDQGDREPKTSVRR